MNIIDDKLLPTQDMMAYMPGDNTHSESTLLEEDLVQFEHILSDQDSEDPSIIAHRIEDKTLPVAM